MIIKNDGYKEKRNDKARKIKINIDIEMNKQ